MKTASPSSSLSLINETQATSVLTLIETRTETFTSTRTIPRSTGQPSSSAGLLSPISTTVHNVMVGFDDKLVFMPNHISASAGDMVRFNFSATNHSLVESSMENPCTPLPGGFSTGFNQFNPSDDGRTIVAFSVDNDTPRYFFCGQTDPVAHCQLGMVFALNAGDNFNTFAHNVLVAGSMEAFGNSSSQAVTLTSDTHTFVTTLFSTVLPTVALSIGSIDLPTLPASSMATTLMQRRKKAP